MNPWGLSSDAHENDWSPRSQFETKVLEAASIGRRNKQSLMMFTCAAASMMATSTVAFRQPWIIWPCNEIFQFRPIRMHGSTTEIPFPDASVNACREIFQQRIRQGFCAGIELSDLPPDHPDSLCSVNASAPLHWLHKSLHPAEVRYGLQISSLETRQSFWMGRLAMRRALRYVDPPLDAQFLLDHAILKDPHGRPLLPQGYYGSISHKGKAGVALVSSTGESVGVDLEDSWRRQKINVAPKVLTRAEIATLGNTPVCGETGRIVLKGKPSFVRYDCFPVRILAPFAI